MAINYSHGRTVTNNLAVYLDAADQNSLTSGSTTWYNLVGSVNGTLTNGPIYTTSSAGSILLDGTNDYININQNINYSQGTLSCWIYPSAVNKNFFVYTISDPTSTYSHQVGISPNGNMYGYIYDGVAKAFSGSTQIPLNAWSYATMTWVDNSLCQIYLNNILVATQSIGTAWKSGAQVRVASNSGTLSSPLSFAPGYLSGSIANFQIYNRALSLDEITQNYNIQKSRFGLS